MALSVERIMPEQQDPPTISVNGLCAQHERPRYPHDIPVASILRVERAPHTGAVIHYWYENPKYVWTLHVYEAPQEVRDRIDAALGLGEYP